MNLILIATRIGFHNKNSFTYKILEEFKKIHRNNEGIVWTNPQSNRIKYVLDAKNTIFKPNNTIIHLRSAHPNIRHTILTKRGYLIVNDPKVTRLTSHKINTMKLFKGKILIPNYLDITNANLSEIVSFFKENPRPFFIKPNFGTIEIKNKPLLIDIDEPHNLIKKIFASKDYFNNENIYIQTLFNFDILYRVILIDKKPIATFLDFPDENHMASACINEKIIFVKNPDINLLNLASFVQKEIKGEINYIDFFWSKKEGYALSEINTACDLLLHEDISGINIAKKIAENLYKKAKQKFGTMA